MALTTGPDGGLTVLGTGQSTFSGPLRLFRNAQQSRGAAWLLELYQDEVRTQFGAGADVYPGIRFRHDQHFETTLEARPYGFHLLNEGRESYAGLRASWTALNAWPSARSERGGWARTPLAPWSTSRPACGRAATRNGSPST